MDSKVTVSVRSVLLTGLVLMALVTAYLLGSTGDGAVTAPAQAAEQPAAAAPDGQRLVRMVGSGEATAVPDQLTFSLAVTAKRTDLDDALADSSASLRRVLTRLEGLGVERRDVQTTGLSMNPEYDYPSYGPPVLTGYRVTQRARVLVDELADGGRAVAAAVDAGGNGVRVSGIRLQVSDPDAVLEKARDAAVAAATAKADQYAEATGQDLGEVLSIREVGTRTSGTRDLAYKAQYGGLTAAVDRMALPVRAGRDDLTVRIEVTWALG
jgi:hypothetical protein